MASSGGSALWGASGWGRGWVDGALPLFLHNDVCVVSNEVSNLGSLEENNSK